MSLAELVIILIVGLIIVGPDRLPQAIKSGMVWINRIKRLINDTRSEFEQQLGVDEIRREIHNEQVLASLKALEEAKQNLRETGQQIDRSLHDTTEQNKAQNKAEPRAINEEFEDDEHLYGEQLGNHPERAQPASEDEGGKAEIRDNQSDSDDKNKNPKPADK